MNYKQILTSRPKICGEGGRGRGGEGGERMGEVRESRRKFYSQLGSRYFYEISSSNLTLFFQKIKTEKYERERERETDRNKDIGIERPI